MPRLRDVAAGASFDTFARRRINGAIVAELPERDQLLVRRRFHDGVELVVVAEELGTPYRTAKRRYASTLYQLGKALSRRGIEGPGKTESG